MSIEAVGTDIQFTVSKPLDLEIILLKIGIFNMGKRFDPIDLLRLLRPKLIWLFNRFLITLKVLRLIDARGFFKTFRYWIDLFHIVFSLI